MTIYVRVASRNRRLAHMTGFYVTVDSGCRRSSAYIQKIECSFFHGENCRLKSHSFIHIVKGKWWLA